MFILNVLCFEAYVRQIAGVMTGTVELGFEAFASENHSLPHCSVSLLGGRLQLSLSQLRTFGRHRPLRTGSMNCLFEADDSGFQLKDTLVLSIGP